jgi:hypothetical protein
MKKTRIATDKDENGVSFIEIDETGVLWLGGVEGGGSVRLPCCIDDVAAFFSNIGREFDPSRLPANAVHYPY